MITFIFQTDHIRQQCYCLVVIRPFCAALLFLLGTMLGGVGGGVVVGFSELSLLRLFRQLLPTVTAKGSRAECVRPRKNQWMGGCKPEF